MIEKMPKNGGRTKPVEKAVDNVPLSKPISVKAVVKSKKASLKKLKKQPKTKAASVVVDKPVEKKKRGGARPNSGRKPGSVLPKTLDRLARARQIKERIAHNADRILNAQLNLAVGQTFLFVKVTERDSKGKVSRVYHERITDEEKIIEYLDGELEGMNPLNTDEEYYYISTKPANNLAIQDLLNRGLGKPTDHVEMTGADGGPIQTEAKTGAVLPDNNMMMRLSKALEKALNEPRTDIPTDK